MIGTDEGAFICDMAETYGIYDYKKFPQIYIATLANGLRETSRIRMIMNETKVSMDTLLLASMTDKLALLLWSKTKGAEKNIGRPASVVEELLGRSRTENKDIRTFTSGEDFDRARKEILRKFKKGKER